MIVKKALSNIVSDKVPDAHHFYISFLTSHPGVKISKTLKDKYPKEITIVLQHEFYDFQLKDSSFSVQLSFNNVPEQLEVPFSALTSFIDPSVKFGMQLNVSKMASSSVAVTQEQPKPETQSPLPNNVISLDKFRKKREQHS
jgi:hypothetical protein